MPDVPAVSTPRVLAEQASCRHLHRNLHRRLAAGFVVLVALMVLLTGHAVLHMSTLEGSMRDIVELRNLKIQLASELIEASHRRHDTLVYQVVTEDAFARDEHFQRFISAGYQVGKLRNELRALPLDDFERKNFEQQDELIQQIVVLHDEISDLARQGRLAEAQRLLATDLHPLNRKFVALVNELRQHESRINRDLLTHTHNATRKAIGLSVVLGGALILLAIGIAFVAIRQLRLHALTIDAQLRALEEAGLELEHEATHDALTGLANRALFYRRLQQAIAHAREERLKAAVLYIDLNDFKPVNDRYGHAVGDALLRVVTRRILRNVRATDTVARLGGDEFAVVLLGIGEVDLIERIKKGITAAVHQPAHIDGHDIQPGCSIGHAVFPDDGDTVDALLHAADIGMYAAKRECKNDGAACCAPTPASRSLGKDVAMPIFSFRSTGPRAMPGARFCVALCIGLGIGLTALAAFAAPALTGMDTAGRPIRLSVLAIRPKAETEARWQPLVDYLNRELPDARFELVVQHMEEMDADAARGEIDFVFTQPGHYVLLTYRNRLSSPLASLVNKEGGFALSQFGGVIFTRAERDDLTRLSDLRGKTLAAVGRNALGAYQMQAFELLQVGVRLPEDARLLETGLPQDNVVAAVLDGRADAGFVRTGVIEAMAAQGRIDARRIRVLAARKPPGFPFLASTRLYPEWPFAAMPHVGPDLARRVAAALLSIPPEGELAQRMNIAGFTIPGDYRSIDELLRQLRLPPFDAAPEFTLDDVWERFRHPLTAGAVIAILILALGMLALYLVNRRWIAERDRVTRSDARQRALFSALGEGVLGCDLDARCTFINPKAMELLACNEADCLGQDVSRLLGDRAEEDADDLRASILDPRSCRGETTLSRRDGRRFPVEYVVTPLLENGQPRGSVIVFNDISARKENEARIHHLAFFDALTGLPNRSLLVDRLGQSLARCQRAGHRGVLMLLNIDRFKVINTACGSNTGDALLKAVGGRLVELFRAGDSVARLAADEFAILLSDIDSGDTGFSRRLTTTTERLHGRLRAPFQIHGEEFNLSISLGVTHFPDARDDGPDAVLARADTALRRAKAAGGNQTVFFETGIGEAVAQRYRIENELRQAIAGDELRLFLQPQVGPGGCLVGAEALVRWQHPQRGLLSPGVFIPLAEESDLIVELGSWALAEASRLLAETAASGLDLRLAVNLSPRHFRHGSLVPWLRDLLAASGADPRNLTLEITEGLVIDNLSDVVRKMNELAALGIHFAIDDFGTGYSALAYLKHLPIHELKIDRAFVQDAPSDPDDAALADAILAIARHMQLRVVAEGVENASQAAFLDARPDVVRQGYHYGRPEPAEVWIERWHRSTRAEGWQMTLG